MGTDGVYRWLLGAALLIAPGSAAQGPGVVVIVRGDDAASEARAALGAVSLPVELLASDLPREVPLDRLQGDADGRIAAARKAYVNADFPACLSQLEPESLLVDALGQGQRIIAARLLLWQTACLVGAGRTEGAGKTALRMGTFGLELPLDAAAVTPEVEVVLARGLRAAQALPTARLRIDSEGPATVAVDGRPVPCNAPCTLEVIEGLHVVRIEVDGFEPKVLNLHANAPETVVRFEAVPASPALAAAQWQARYADSGQVDSTSSLRLLTTALRAPRLVLITAERESGEARLRGVLAVDGNVAARAERTGAAKEEVGGLLRDLLVRGRVVEPAPALHRRPAFWIVVGAVAVAAAAGTVAIVSRPVVTEVEWR